MQAELRAKTGSPSLGPTHMPQNMVQPPPLPRAILNRHHARRSGSSIAPKLDIGSSSLPPPNLGGMNPGHPTPTSVVASPKSRPTPSSHSASPAASTSAYGQSPAASHSDPSASIRPILTAPAPAPPPPQMQHGQQAHHGHQLPITAASMKAGQLGGPMSGMVNNVLPRAVQQHQQHQQSHQQSHQQHQQHQHQQQQQQHQQQQRPRTHHMQPHLQHQQQHQQQHSQHSSGPNLHPLPSPQPPTPRSAGGAGGAPYYAVPGFQNHIEQLGEFRLAQFSYQVSIANSLTQNKNMTQLTILWTNMPRIPTRLPAQARIKRMPTRMRHRR